jgi:hypothetical protein
VCSASADARRATRQTRSRLLVDALKTVFRASTCAALGRLHDDGAENWAILASLIETAELSGIDPQAWLANILARLVNDELLPWTWAAAREQQQRAA